MKGALCLVLLAVAGVASAQKVTTMPAQPTGQPGAQLPPQNRPFVVPGSAGATVFDVLSTRPDLSVFQVRQPGCTHAPPPTLAIGAARSGWRGPPWLGCWTV